MFWRSILFFLPITCFSFFIFNDANIGLKVGYQKQQMQWSYKQENILDSNAISEDFSSIHFVQFGSQMEWLIPHLLFFRADYTYGYSHEPQAETEMRIIAQDDGGNIFERINGVFKYKLNGQQNALFATLGYPVRFGPICFIPLAGFYFERQTFKRNNLSANQTTLQSGSQTTIARFNPTSFFKNLYTFPYLGLELRITPIPGGRIKLLGNYQYSWGYFQTHSAYSFFTDVSTQAPFRQTIRRIKQDVSLKKFSQMQRLKLSLWVGITKYIMTKLIFHYTYLHASSTNSEQTLKGTQELSTSPGQFTTTQIQQNLKRPFNGLHQQSMGGEVFLGFSF